MLSLLLVSFLTIPCWSWLEPTNTKKNKNSSLIDIDRKIEIKENKTKKAIKLTNLCQISSVYVRWDAPREDWIHFVSNNIFICWKELCTILSYRQPKIWVSKYPGIIHRTCKSHKAVCEYQVCVANGLQSKSMLAFSGSVWFRMKLGRQEYKNKMNYVRKSIR